MSDAPERDRAGELLAILKLQCRFGAVIITLPGLRFVCSVDYMREAFHRGGGDVDPIVRYPAAAKMVGVHKSTLRRYVDEGTMPPPFHISRGVVGWRRSTIEAYIAALEAEAGVSPPRKTMA